MNKKLFLKLGISTLVVASSLSFVACGEKNSSMGVINPSTLNINESENKAENEKINDSSENKEQSTNEQQAEEKINHKTESSKPKAEEKIENSKPKTESSKPKVEQTVENEKPKTEETDNDAEKKPNQNSEEYYYTRIKEAMQKQIDYINSIEDPAIKQSVQSSLGAAVCEATLLEMKYPEDAEIIRASLEKVLNVN